MEVICLVILFTTFIQFDKFKILGIEKKDQKKVEAIA